MIDNIKVIVKACSNLHRPLGRGNIMLFTTPRSGSTWLMELLVHARGFKYFGEPFNVRNPFVQKNLGITNWVDLYSNKNLEKAISYLKRADSGEMGFFNPNPFGKYYRPFSNKIIFKILHYGEDQIDKLSSALNAEVVYLIRHPIAVSLSRKKTPRIEAMLQSDFRHNFTDKQLEFSRGIISKDNHFRTAIVSWCMQNMVILNNFEKSWNLVTYEDLVRKPQETVRTLYNSLCIEYDDRLEKTLRRPSMVSSHSDDAKIQHVLSGSTTRIISSWCDTVTQDEREFTQKALNIFNIDLYCAWNEEPQRNLSEI